jgi:hypothetical protein
VRQLRGSLLVAMAALAVAVVCGSVARANPPEVQKKGIAYAKGHDASHGPSSRVLLTYHNGGVMTNGAVVETIYWGSSWATYTGDKVTGITTLYKGIGGSSYLNTNLEYTQSGGAHVSDAVAFQGTTTDATSAGSRDPGTSGVLAEVQKALAAAHVTPVPNGYYPVYTDIPRGSAGYCAWHSWGSIGSTPVQFAFFFDLDNDPGCDPVDGGKLGHSQGLAALANVSGHELSEALTDPRGAGWFDQKGAENADKCAWTWDGNVTIGGESWKIQGNFSNNAYNSRSGYDGAGCIQTAS